jgi:REP element-mobilizing transposase RayT
MLRGFHVICTTYGFWLPNDERGSGSDYVRADHLTKFGPANPVSTRKSVARKPFDRKIRKLAREELKYPYIRFTGKQARCVGLAFKEEIEKYGGIIHACAILPDHFHLVVAQHRYDIRLFIARLKGAATKKLRADGLHPFLRFPLSDGSLPSPWGRKPWVVYLWNDEEIRREIKYVNDNPIRIGLPEQHWSFITPFEPRTRGAAPHR